MKNLLPLLLIPLVLTCQVDYDNRRNTLVRFDYDVRLELVDDDSYLQAQKYTDDIQRDIDRLPAGGLTFLILSCKYDPETEEIARSLSLRNNVILAEHNDC